MLNGIVYRETKDRKVSKLLLLCLSCGTYAATTLALAFGVQNFPLAVAIMFICPIAGISSFAFYMDVMQEAIGKEVPGKRRLKDLVWLANAICLTIFFEFVFMPTSYLYDAPPGTASPNLLLNNNIVHIEYGIGFQIIMAFLFLGVCWASGFFLKCFRSTKAPRLLFVGVILNFIFIANDITMAAFPETGLVPIGFASYFLETCILTFSAIHFSTLRTKSLEGEVLEAEKAAEVGALAGQICHDIRNPLSVVNGNHYYFEKIIGSEDFSNPGIMERRAISSRKAIDRITTIISDYLSLLRDESADPESYANVKKIIENAINISSSKTKYSGVKLSLDIPENIEVLALENRFVMVFANLISNSADAIEHMTEAWIDISFDANLTHGFLRVRDSGSGIPADIQRKMFDRQFTTKGKGKGTGLGLSFVKKVIEGNAGEIYVSPDTPNTEIVIKLPISKFRITATEKASTDGLKNVS